MPDFSSTQENTAHISARIIRQICTAYSAPPSGVTLISDDLENDIVVNDSSTLTNTTIWFVAALSLIVDVRTYVRMDGHFYRVY